MGLAEGSLQYTLKQSDSKAAGGGEGGGGGKTQH